jgi:transcriptional regulator with XRE-family HTH domain
MVMNKPTIVAVNVKKLLKSKQMSQKEFATVTGYDYKKLNNKLNGYESIYPEDIVFFYSALGCDVNKLFEPVEETA